eukprot:12555445-Prorocentrum_lima.AAC.1
MTSSLVGSEMCIRDSSKALQMVCAAPHALIRSAHQTGFMCPECGHAATACLLYTSDAADDM